MLTGKCLCECVRFELDGPLAPLGSPVYKRVSDQPESVRVRLGLVDGDPQLRPRLHVWVSAKAPWYEIADALPQLPEGLPPRK